MSYEKYKYFTLIRPMRTFTYRLSHDTQMRFITGFTCQHNETFR